MAWQGGFEGDSYDRAAFRAWLRRQKKPIMFDSITVHNTGAPYTLASVGGARRMANLANYYRNQKGWKGGPHFFVMEDRVYPGTPVHLQTVHSPSWNRSSASVECEGDYDGTHDPTEGKGKIAWDTMAWVFAEYLDWMDWPIDAQHIRLHREDPATTHACPGKLVSKDWFLKKVLAAAGYAVPAAPLPEQTNRVLVVDTPGDTLNFRRTPGGEKKGELPHRTKVIVLAYDGAWAYVQSPAGYKGYVFAKYLAETVPPPIAVSPAPALPPAPPPASATATTFAPGTFSPSQFAYEWARRFEGLMLTAYWDNGAYAIGYGHNGGSGVPPAVNKGDTITRERAEEILDADMKLQARYLNAYVSVPLTQGQIDALILHIFQQGPGNFREGDVRPLVNAGRHAEAADRIEAWPTANAGLKRRRAVEAAIYRGEKPTRW